MDWDGVNMQGVKGGQTAEMCAQNSVLEPYMDIISGRDGVAVHPP